jgi:nondiscriminating glutamyl-tRNA synthetase
LGYNPKPKSNIRVRFAPSPTGPPHAGNIRTALFNWLFARHSGGEMVLRIEDTDLDRSSTAYGDQLIEALEWLGIDWDEGPYYQSQHATLYTKVIDQLIGDGKLYPCFCSDELLEKDRQEFVKKSLPPVYAGRCRELTSEELERKKGEPYALRFIVPGDRMEYHDAIKGGVSVDLGLVGDFIVRRSSGMVTYNFAAAVDDSMMKISHVIRGEDHVSNTTRQRLIIDAIGLEPPVYAHLPLILSESGKKLSKRDSGASFSELMEGGYLPEAVMNFLVLIGWSPEGGDEEMEREDMIKTFSLGRVSKSPAKYDIEKLRWFNARKIRKAGTERVLEFGRKFIKKYDIQFKGLKKEEQTFLIKAVAENIEVLSDLDYQLSVFFEYNIDKGVVLKVEEYPAKKVLEAFIKASEIEGFDEMIAELKRSVPEAKGKGLFMPIRAALTGRLHGPELKHVFSWLSPGLRRERAEKFLSWLE